MTHDELKTKQRSIRDGLPPNLGLRVHRALSWLSRGEQAGDDHDAAMERERSVFDEFFRKLTGLDSENRIYNVIWERYPQAIRLLLNNRYVYQPFWKHHNGTPGYGDWAQRFDRSKRNVARALAQKDTRVILATLFDRLYVLRNQLVHGGATWGSSVNREQVRDGARIMALLVPVFVDLMMDHPEEHWGAPYYPVVE